MGFAGHVFDMIRRNRELRETQDLRRWRTRSIREKMCDNDHEMGINSELTASQWDEVRKQSRNRVAFERHSFFKFKLICLGVLAIVAAITVVVVYFVLGK